MLSDNEKYNTNKIIESEVNDIKKYINNKDSVLCFDIPARIYLILDIMPGYRFFTGQSWHIYNDNKIEEEMIESIYKNDIKYIITYVGNDLPFLNRYDLIYKNSSFQLYELKTYTN